MQLSAHAIGKTREAAGKRRNAARRIADHARREIEQQLVDQPGGEQRAVEPGARLDVQLVDPARGELAHHRGEIDAAVGIRQRERRHAARPRGIGAAGRHDERIAAGEHARRGRRLAVAVDDDDAAAGASLRRRAR